MLFAFPISLEICDDWRLCSNKLLWLLENTLALCGDSFKKSRQDKTRKLKTSLMGDLNDVN